MSTPEYKKVANYSNSTEAEHVCSILKDEGLIAFVDRANANSMMSHIGSALGGVTIFVAAADAERAFEIIASLDIGIDTEADPWFCKPCQVERLFGLSGCATESDAQQNGLRPLDEALIFHHQPRIKKDPNFHLDLYRSKQSAIELNRLVAP